MLCRKCGREVDFTGPAAVRVSGIGYLAPMVHTEDGRELGDDGHVAAPPWDAGLARAA